MPDRNSRMSEMSHSSLGFLLHPLPHELNLANQWGLFIPWISVCTLSMEGILTKTAKTLADQTFISSTVLAQMND